jgi:aerobic C4-dicarboxylate transport protein
VSTPLSQSTAPKRRIYNTLYFWVLVAIACGVLLGHFKPELAVEMRPLGEAFIRLVKMIVAPLIFCTVVTGIAGMSSMKAVGRTGLIALIYFEVVSTIALLVGLLVISIVKPGAGMNVDPASLDASAVQAYAQAAHQQSVMEFLLNIIPNTAVDAFAKGEILPVLLFAVLFGFGLHGLGERGTPVFEFIERLGQVFFRIVAIIMKVAPIGAFGAMAYTIGKYGVGTLAALAQLMACFYGTCLLFVFAVLGAIAAAHGFSIWKLVKYVREELLIVLGTSSSESVLPRMLSKLERAGCSKAVVGLVVPTGYSFNLDGTAIYLTMAAVFVAQATNTQMTLGQELLLLAVLVLTSKGAAAVTGGGFITLAATLAAIGHVPVAGLALILGIDRFMSEARALTNLVGNGVATIVVAKWCGELDNAQLQAALDAGPGNIEYVSEHA